MRRFRSFSIRKKLLTGNISIILVMVILLGISNYMTVSYTHLTLPTNSRV